MLLNNGCGVKDKLLLVMTQKDKDLLVKDLCARLPYGVIIEHEGNLSTLDTFFMCDSISISSTSIDKELFYNLDLDEFKPYLFPLSSMTEEQRFEYHNNCDVGLTEWGNELYYDCAESFDWLNAHHFDYRGLIEKGLAIDATDFNIY
jgi:hypothetical protein